MMLEHGVKFIQRRQEDFCFTVWKGVGPLLEEWECHLIDVLLLDLRVVRCALYFI